MKPLTYRDAGVDIEAGDEAVRRLAPHAHSTTRPEVLGTIGAFASFVRVPAGYTEPVLVSSTDGVGSKLNIAFLADRHDTVGVDLVAMGVNDILVAERAIAVLIEAGESVSRIGEIAAGARGVEVVS